MWLVPSALANHWAPIESTPEVYAPAHMDVACPSCLRSLVQSELGWTTSGPIAHASVCCKGCRKVATFVMVPVRKAVSKVRRGDAGYGSHLDRDGDGVACE